MKEIITSHRFVFLTTFTIGAIALFKYPGFECRGYFLGSIIGLWPFMIVDIFIPNCLFSMGIFIFILPPLTCAIQVGLCAWFLDRRNMTKKIWFVVLFLVLTGLVVGYCTQAGRFEIVRCSQAIQAAEGCPEANYRFAQSDFNENYVIPVMIAFGMIGFYIATLGSILYAMGILLESKISAINAEVNSRLN